MASEPLGGGDPPVRDKKMPRVSSLGIFLSQILFSRLFASSFTRKSLLHPELRSLPKNAKSLAFS